jgi:hypothetical protein
MPLRTDLQSILENLLGSDAVYYQPPETVRMSYPCIVYSVDNALTRFADNKPYSYDKAYILTVIDQDPDSPIPNKIAELPKCRFDRQFVADNLYHVTFKVFF